MKRAVMQHAFERELAAGNEAFDEDRLVRFVALRADVGRLQQHAQPVDGGRKRRRIVRAHHAAAA